MKLRTYAALTVGLGLLASAILGVGQAPLVGQQPPPLAQPAPPKFTDRFPELGHRNWIVIADAAYPVQSRPGIEMYLTDGKQLDLVRETLTELGKCKHIRPVIYLDKELAFVDDKDAPGIAEYRRKLEKVLGDRPQHTLLHDNIIEKLDKTAEKFRVLVIKSDMTLPYTTVFIELECGYWSEAAEKRLREKMQAAEKP